jgi:hypothetical protein
MTLKDLGPQVLVSIPDKGFGDLISDRQTEDGHNGYSILSQNLMSIKIQIYSP